MMEHEDDQSAVYAPTVTSSALPEPSSSSSRLVADDQDDSVQVITPAADGERYRNARAYTAVAILFVVNLLNYMDRFTITGVLIEVQQYFRINNAYAGALQTVFICSYMVFAPIFGYLGDRYCRRNIMTFGIAAWVLAVFLSSFVPANHFWLFLVLRAVVGIGEASYVTVAPTIIADLFTQQQRSQMLMYFYFAIPVGTGLGFIVGSNVADWTNDWRWGVRVTPMLGLVCLALIVCVLPEPERGQVEHVHLDDRHSSIGADLKYLAYNRTYVYSTIGFTFIVFVVGSMSWWTPNAVLYSYGLNGHKVTDSLQARVSLIFGIISVVSGLLGVFAGTNWAAYWKRTNAAADPLVCAYSALAAVPFLFVALITMAHDIMIAWVCIFCGITLMCFNWSVIMDMLLYIVVPQRRATASAFQILASHLLGDAFSPYLIGQISASLEGGDASYATKFRALQTALYIPTFLLIGAGAFLLLSSFFVVEDRMRAEALTRALGWGLSAFRTTGKSTDRADDTASVNSQTIHVDSD